MDVRCAAGTVARPAQERPRLIRHFPLALGLALLAVLYLVGPVAAAQPFIERFVDSQVETLDCGTFEATLERNFTGTQTVYFGQQGNPTRVQVVAHMAGTLTSDTGTVVHLRGNLMVVIDLVKGTFTFDGQVFMANQPGAGVVIQDTGKFLVDAEDNVLLDAGPHQAIETGGAIFCTALL